MPSICREADVLIVARGRANVVDASYFNPDQIVIDVGINVDENGRLCGDVKFEDAEKIVKAVNTGAGRRRTVTDLGACQAC